MKSQTFFSLLVVLLFSSSCSFKTTPETSQVITNHVELKDFTVHFNTAHPIRMQQVNLTSEYTLRIKGDSAEVFLPYFGVAYVVPYNSSEGGIKFNGLTTDYKTTINRKKDGWEIRFKMNSVESHCEFYLSLFNNGNAILNISSYERDPITFYGELK